MSEALEKAAEAAHQSYGDQGVTWFNDTEDTRDMFRAFARAAITAFLDAAKDDPSLSQFFGAQAGVIDALKRIANQ